MDLHDSRYAYIINGYSLIDHDGEKVFCKHFGLHDHVETDFIYNCELERAKELGIDSREERMDFLFSEELWSEEKENEIGRLQDTIRRTEESKKTFFLPSQKQQINEALAKHKEDLNTLLLEKAELVGRTCEDFAQEEADTFFVLNALFKDQDLTIPLIDPEEFENLDSGEIQDLILLYNKAFQGVSGSGIKEVALSSPVQSQISISETAYDFYAKPVSKLTFLQTELYIYAKNYSRMLSNDPAPPAEFRSDPEKLEDWFDSAVLSDKAINKHEGGDVAIIGTPEDVKAISGNEQVESMDSKIKNSIGEKGYLSMEDMMQLRG